MTRRISPIALCAIIALSISTAVALADPAGKTTLEETIQRGAGRLRRARQPARRELRRPPAHREAAGGTATRPRQHDRVLRPVHRSRRSRTRCRPAASRPTDRLDHLESSGGRGRHGRSTTSTRRCRNMNDNRTSPVRQGNGKPQAAAVRDHHRRHRRLAAAERDALGTCGSSRVGTVDPFSGKPIGPGNPCSGDDVTQADIDRLNADVAARRYTGHPGLRGLARPSGRPLRRLLGSRTGAARRGLAVRAVPAPPRAHGTRAAAVHRRGAGHAVVHGARQPRRPAAGDGLCHGAAAAGS